MGGTANDFSGEFALAFSTSTTFLWGTASHAEGLISDTNEGLMDAIFDGTVQAVEEAAVNQLVASQTMQGINETCVFALPHDRLIQSLVAHRRLHRAAGNPR
jgi:L-aminopeptidase/D-esterase-like protein